MTLFWLPFQRQIIYKNTLHKRKREYTEKIQHWLINDNHNMESDILFFSWFELIFRAAKNYYCFVNVCYGEIIWLQFAKLSNHSKPKKSFNFGFFCFVIFFGRFVLITGLFKGNFVLLHLLIFATFVTHQNSVKMKSGNLLKIKKEHWSISFNW